METAKKVLGKVYLYYPKNASFSSIEYQSSKEYLNLLKKRKEAHKDIMYQKYLKNRLDNLFENYAVVDWTDLESYNDYEYRILLHKNQPILDDDINLLRALGNKRLDLFLFISALEKYYYFLINYTEFCPKTTEYTRFHEETGKWVFRTMSTIPAGLENKIEKLRHFLLSNNYVELSDEIAKQIIIDVSTELKPVGSATVFDCFFTDVISIDIDQPPV